MTRLPVLVALVATGAAFDAGTARAESAPQPPACEASTAIPSVTALPAGCPLAAFAAQTSSDRPFEVAPVPMVFVHIGDRPPVRAEVSIATSWTRMRGRISYCAPSTCTDEVDDGEIEAVRYDLVFAAPPPVGATLEITGAGDSREVVVTEAGPCPAVVPPTVTCELPRCGQPDAHCFHPDPEPSCDGGLDPSPSRDGAVDRDDPGDERGHRGCAVATPTAMSPLVVVAGIALVAALRRRRR